MDDNDLFDENGKARFGTPGPGEYVMPGSFGETVVYGTASAYSFGIKPDPKSALAQPFISRAHSKADGGHDSPGPAYNPSHAYGGKYPNEPKASFGTADRAAEKLRFISKAHMADSAGVSTPGPGTYRLKHGKGVAKTLGDAPTFKFTEAERDNYGNREHRFHPGPGAHDVPSTMDGPNRDPRFNWAPKVSFAPSRAEGHSLSRSGGLPPEPKGPGPGDYNMKSSMGCMERDTYIDSATSATHHPVVTFPRAIRGESKNNPYISSAHTAADPSTIASPGPIYYPKDIDQALKSTSGLKWGSSKRFHNTELGPEHAGPFISRVHSEQEGAGSDSPGPAHYTLPYGDEYDPSRGHKFPTQIRMDLKPKVARVPGPGAHQIPKNAPELTGRTSSKAMTRAAAYSVASCLRTDFTALSGTADFPAAIYDVDVGISKPDPRKKQQRGARFGKCTNRSSFMPSDLGVPGPGAYGAPIDPRKKAPSGAVAFTGSGGPVNPKPIHQQSDLIETFRREGTQGAMMVKPRPTHEVPGPGHYKLKEGKGHARTLGDAPTMRFSTGTRQAQTKMYLGPEHVKVDAAESNCNPGPGSYTPKGLSGFSSRYKNHGGCSFGTSKRPPMATVKF